MRRRIGYNWLCVGLIILAVKMPQMVQADVYSLVNQDRSQGDLRRPEPHRRLGSSVRLRPQQYNVQHRNVGQHAKTTAIVQGYRGFLPLQGQRQNSVQAEDGSVLDSFCSVYEGLCPDSRRFSLSATPVRQLIVKTEIITETYRQLAQEYMLHSALGAGRYHTTENDHASTLKAQFDLSTPASQQLQHGWFLRAALLSSTNSHQAQNNSAKTVTLGYRQQVRLPVRLSSVLFGLDDIIWELARGQNSQDGRTTERTDLHLAQLWGRGARFVRISADWHRYYPPSGSLLGPYHQHTQRIDGGLNSASASGFAALFSYFHIHSVQLSYARTRSRFSRPLPWQAASQDTEDSQTSLKVVGDSLIPNMTPFVLLQEVVVMQSALAVPGRHHSVSLGVAIQF